MEVKAQMSSVILDLDCPPALEQQVRSQGWPSQGRDNRTEKCQVPVSQSQLDGGVKLVLCLC